MRIHKVRGKNLNTTAVATLTMDQPAKNRSRPASLQEEVATSLQWAAGVVQDEMARLAKSSGLTLPQYQVLRILRDADEPLSCSEIAERMIARDPDITRLIDKLEKAGMVQRARDGQDRRVVRSSITEKGAGKVTPLDPHVDGLHQKLLAHIPESELREWSRRLRSLRRAH